MFLQQLTEEIFIKLDSGIWMSKVSLRLGKRWCRFGIVLQSTIFFFPARIWIIVYSTGYSLSESLLRTPINAKIVHFSSGQKNYKAFLDFRGFDFLNFWFNAVYDSILFFDFRGHVLIKRSFLNPNYAFSIFPCLSVTNKQTSLLSKITIPP